MTNRSSNINDGHLGFGQEKAIWSDSAGAIFPLNGVPLSDDKPASCNDASCHLGDKAHVYTVSREAYGRVRIFVLENASGLEETESWRLVDRQLSFKTTQLAEGLTLTSDGRDYERETGMWEPFDVYETRGSEDRVSDAVVLKIGARWTHHHLQQVEVSVTAGANDSEPAWQRFSEQTDVGSRAAGVPSMILFNQSFNI
ncbi:protein-arginine deiminase [Geosmithia morbida]|uniref:Protein-arginine deiminase n=1 Tax=Geosmithia morbida TaxID=1094350 RepID=A0A9P5D438_9HYPO|nr:protein-arginine deiminase [Geosmithia morbida]KAF4125642.1 protein-arginine deiminase [Geosmithia morbida]